VLQCHGYKQVGLQRTSGGGVQEQLLKSSLSESFFRNDSIFMLFTFNIEIVVLFNRLKISMSKELFSVAIHEQDS
jgi:hypothetical protein